MPSFLNVSNTSFARPSDDQLTVWREEYIETMKQYNAWAEKTIVGNVVEPISGLKVRDLLAEGTWEGMPMLIINPNGKGGTIGAHNSVAMTSAFMAAFAYRDYETLEIGYHARRFNKASANEQDVITVRGENTGDNGVEIRYKRQSWIAGRPINDTPNPASPEGKYWFSKHQELDLLLMALKGDQVIHCVFFQDWAYDKYVRRVISRLDKTVAEAKKELAEDAKLAQAARSFRDAGKTFGNREPKKMWAGEPIVIDSIDLSKATQPVVLRVKTSASGDAYDMPINPKNPADLQMIFANLGKENVEIHIK